MKKIILLLILLSFTISYSQNEFNSKNSSVSKNDLETNIYTKDSTANALVIYEIGNSYIDKFDFKLKHKFQQKLKIINRKGFDEATISISLSNNDISEEKILNIVATTFNLIDGEIVSTKLNEKDIFEDIKNDHWKVVKFTLPNIKEGSVITYSYEIESPFIYKYIGWEFQSNIPKLYSEYRTSIPGNYDYNIKLVGALKLTDFKNEIEKSCLIAGNGGVSDCSNSIYVMKDIPAFIEEDYMTAKNNYLSRIEYELKVFKGFDGTIDNVTKTWTTTDQELKEDENIGRQLRKSTHLEKVIDTSILNETNPLKKAKALYKFVRDNYTWNDSYFIFSEASIKDLIKEHSGTVSEINILLNNLLNENGIESKAVLLSTRENGLPTKLFPVMSEFNYLIAQATIDNKTYLLDATDNYMNFGELPFRCLNGYGRLLDFKNGSEWINIEPNKLSTSQFLFDLKFTEKNTITGNLNSRYIGYPALFKKKAYFPNPDNYIEELDNQYSYLEIINHSLKSKGKDDSKFQESIDIELTFTETADKVYLNPILIKYINSNPFKLQERTYPIDFGYKQAFIYTFQLDLKDKYEVLEMPENINITLPNNTGDLTFTAKSNGNKLTVFFKINIKESLYSSSYYEYLKSFMSKIIETQTKSLIVLKKK